MNRESGSFRYTTRYIDDEEGGSAGLEMLREDVFLDNGYGEPAANVIYWDATGAWEVQTFCEVPLLVLEQLIKEAKVAVFPPSSPPVTHISWGRMEIEGIGIGRDFKLYPGGGRPWDWKETDTHHVPGIQPADVQELLDNGSRIIVLSRGMEWVQISI